MEHGGGAVDKSTNESITLRLGGDTLEALRMEASQKQTSVNTLVSQVLTQYVRWYSNANMAGFISVRKTLLEKLLESHTEEQVISIAAHVSKTAKDNVLLLRSQYNMANALDVLETWIAISGFTYKHAIDGSRHTFVIQHEMGKKWSLYLAELCRNMCHEFGIAKFGSDLGESVVMIEIDTSS